MGECPCVDRGPVEQAKRDRAGAGRRRGHDPPPTQGDRARKSASAVRTAARGQVSPEETCPRLAAELAGLRSRRRTTCSRRRWCEPRRATSRCVADARVRGGEARRVGSTFGRESGPTVAPPGAHHDRPSLPVRGPVLRSPARAARRGCIGPWRASRRPPSGSGASATGRLRRGRKCIVLDSPGRPRAASLLEKRGSCQSLTFRQDSEFAGSFVSASGSRTLRPRLLQSLLCRACQAALAPEGTLSRAGRSLSSFSGG